MAQFLRPLSTRVHQPTGGPGRNRGGNDIILRHPLSTPVLKLMPKATSRWKIAHRIAGAAASGYAAYKIARNVRDKVKPWFSRPQGRNVSGVGVSGQHDRANVYRRRRAPRRKRMRARRSMKSFKSKILKMKGHRTFFTNSQFSVSSVASQQSAKSWVIYGGRTDGTSLTGGILRGYDDMEDMRKKDYMLDAAAGDAENRFHGGNLKWYIKTAIIDMTIQNNSENSVPIEMDIYEFTCGVLPSAAGGDVETAMQYYHQDTLLSGADTAGLDAYTLATRGITPFEMGTAMSKFRMKILKKTKYFIPFGNTVTYQIRDTRIRTMTHNVYRAESATTYCTHGVLIIAKPTAVFADTTCNYVVGCSRKYKYVIDSSHVDRAGLFHPAIAA